MSKHPRGKRSLKSSRRWFRAAKNLRTPKSRQFEKLEDRHLFTVAPAQAVVVSNPYQVMLDQALKVAFVNASDLTQYTAAQKEDAAIWVVKTSGAMTPAAFQTATGMAMQKQVPGLTNTYYAYAGNLSANQIVNKLQSLTSVQYFYPQVAPNRVTMSLPNDPYLYDQWHLRNSGQIITNPNTFNQYGTWGEDINIEEAWKITRGEGVLVAVNDDGLYFYHPDLAANYNAALDYDFTRRSSTLITDIGQGDFHGTAVGGIIGAVGNNGIGGAGIAYEATLTASRILGYDPTGNQNTPDIFYAALVHRMNEIDVYNNSWGEGNPDRTISPLTPEETIAYFEFAFLGNNGLGSIHIFSAGNDAETWDTANLSGNANSPYVVTVSGYGPNGTAVSYAEAGPSIFVTAPTGTNGPDTTTVRGILTTDIPGDLGYNNSNTTGLTPDHDWFLDTNYTSTFNGTSASAPMVSGVVALMVAAARQNGVELSLRDVQHILARSARKIDPFDLGGNDEGGWQTNARPIYNDPFDFGGIPIGAIDPSYPVLVNGVRSLSGVPASLDFQFARPTNGAGYYVHDGFDYGHGHGAIDAKLAVELASTWKSVGGQSNVQILSSTQRNLSIPAAEIVVVGGQPIVIPGGINGNPGFEEYFDLWLNPPADLPNPLPQNTRGAQSVSYIVPANRNVEWIELNLDMTLAPGSSNQLRFTLVSPDGVHTEFTNWERDAAKGPITADGAVNFTFTTNRHWGERTEGVGQINPLTGERIEPNAIVDANGVTTAGVWQLVIENWGGAPANISSANLVFHTTQDPVLPYGANGAGGRIQGSIGLDINEDGVYNFNPVFGVQLQNGLGEMVIVDQFPNPTGDSFILTDTEPMVAGVKVYIDRNDNGVWDTDEMFTYTTADGNYYFDLPWNDPRITDPANPNFDYTVRFDLPAGYTAIGDTSHTFRIGEVQADGSKLAYYIESHFVLQPAPITFQGNVFADFDIDGIRDFTEASVEGFRVFIDLNENGFLDFIDFNANGLFDNGIDEAVEPMVITGPDGSYSVELNTSFNIPMDIFGNQLFFNDLYTGAGNYTVMLDQNPGWAGTGRDVSAAGFAGSAGATLSPSLAYRRVWAEPGETLTLDSFGTAPSVGTISGFVYSDNNRNGTRQANEAGLAGFTVYLDIDNSGTLTAADTTVVTGANGNYLFNNVAAGTYVVRVVPGPGFGAEDHTKPIGGAYTNVVVGVGTSAGNGFLDFGFYDPTAIATAPRDFGDLPAPYATTGAGAASHGIVVGYHLGAGVSAETAGQPGAGADADANDDGVELLSPIIAGSLVRVNVTASTNALFLQGWIDFNNDGDFADQGEHLQFRDASGNLLPFGTQLQLDQGLNELSFYVPSSVDASLLAARFRYGEGGNAQFNKPNGAAILGEVEDYMVPANVSTSFVLPLVGDFNGNGIVDQPDYAIWKATRGSTTDLRADANNDGKVDLADYTIWRDNLGAHAQVVQTIIAGPFSALTSEDGNQPGVLAALGSGSVPTWVSAGGSSLTPFNTAGESEDSTPATPANAAPTTPAIDLAFDLEEEDEDLTEWFLYIADDQHVEAISAALEEEFAEAL